MGNDYQARLDELKDKPQMMPRRQPQMMPSMLGGMTRQDPNLSGPGNQFGQMAMAAGRGQMASAQPAQGGQISPEMIQQLYMQHMGRQADPGGMNYWLNQANTQGMPGVQQAFGNNLESMAYKNKMAQMQRMPQLQRGFDPNAMAAQPQPFGGLNGVVR